MAYEDIIDYDYTGVKYHAHMSNEGRAAQFSPFAALTGFEEEAERTGREHVESYDRKDTADPLNDIC